MNVSPTKFRAISELPGKQRYEHFVKVVADTQHVWGLYQDGWALIADDDGATAFAVWPAEEYAIACAENEWAGYSPRVIQLDEFVGVLLPKLELDGLRPSVFMTREGKGVTPSVDQLTRDIELELKRY